MNISKIPIDVRKLLHSTLLISVSPSYEYLNGSRTNTIVGYKYGVILPEFAYERIYVKIPGEKQMEVSEDAIPVRFEEVEARLYCIDGRCDISVSASSITPAKTTASAKQ